MVSKPEQNDKAGGEAQKKESAVAEPVSPEVLLAEDSAQGGPSALLLGRTALKCHLLKSGMVKQGRLSARKMSPCESPKAPAAKFSFVPALPLLAQVGKRASHLGQELLRWWFQTVPGVLESWDVTAAARGFGAKLTGVTKIASGTKQDISGRGRRKRLAVSLAGQKEASS